jgi:hypothetical protein
VKTPLSFIAEKFRASMATARSGLDELRGRIDDLKAERERVELLPPDSAVLADLVKRTVAKEGKEWAVTTYQFSNPDGVAGHQLVEHFNTAFKNNARGAFGVMSALFPDRMTEMLLAAVPKNGVTDADRAAMLARIDDDILGLEISEEFAVREIEASTGAVMSRRLDANPAVLLAPDGELK